MTSEEASSVTGKISAILKEKKKKKKKGRKKEKNKKELIWHEESVGPKQTLELIRHVILSDLTYPIFFFHKEREGLWPGHDERLNLHSI